MKNIVAILLVFAITTVYFLAEEKERRPMTTDDALNMVSVGGALLSPDGKWMFYSKSELDWPKNNRKTKYYMISTEGGEPFQYIGEAGGNKNRRVDAAGRGEVQDGFGNPLLLLPEAVSDNGLSSMGLLEGLRRDRRGIGGRLQVLGEVHWCVPEAL